jgi:3-deoxy-D-manno-octulosonic-acid transferase
VYFAYNTLFLLALALTSPWWSLEMLRHGKYRAGLGERLGAVPERLKDEAAPETIWIHAVSVGEVLAVARMVEELKARLPDWRVVVSTTTDTGQKLARERFGESNVFYFPLDLWFAVRAYLRAFRPRLLVLAESEFWPNLLHQAHAAQVLIGVVNARVSDRSLPRYLRFRGLLHRIMQNVDVFLAQSEEDARRLVQIGAPAERVHVGGNLKFEVTASAKPQILEAFAAAVRRAEIGPVFVAGSTLEGEEEILLECLRSIAANYPDALMVLAPRHPQRFDAVGGLLAASGLRWQRRSEWDGQQLPVGGIFLLDTIGELASLYQFADLAFVGGSLVPRGGHNVLEAAQFGTAILVGPHTENFRDIVGIFQKADALRVVAPESLTPTALGLLQDDAERERLGQRALEVMRAQQGATERTLSALLQLIGADRNSSGVEAVSERQA